MCPLHYVTGTSWLASLLIFRQNDNDDDENSTFIVDKTKNMMKTLIKDWNNNINSRIFVSMMDMLLRNPHPTTNNADNSNLQLNLHVSI